MSNIIAYWNIKILFSFDMFCPHMPTSKHTTAFMPRMYGSGCANQGASDVPEHAGRTENVNKILIFKYMKDRFGRSKPKTEDNIKLGFMFK
jgi:hypothetical protein